MAETDIKIDGMSCQHCVAAVKKALEKVPGIIESKVEIGHALVKYDDAKTKEIDVKRVIEEAGYKVK